MRSGRVDVAGAVTGEAGWISYAHWVRDALGLIRSGAPGKIGLFESSVPEPSAMLADTVAAAFRNGPPASYQSIFMRNNPVLTERLSERYGVATQNIVCTTGATSAIQLIYPALLEPGDHVLIERPGFDIFANYAVDADMEIGFFDRPAPDFLLSVDAVLGKLTRRTRMVVISNLHNPSGSLIEDADLIRLARELRHKGVYLLIDEVYRDYFEKTRSHLDVAEHPNVLRIGSMTKIFGMSTLRCGWVFASGDALDGIRRACDRRDFSVSKLSHAVAAEVLARSSAFDGWRQGHMTSAVPVAQSAFAGMVDDGLVEMKLPLEGCICFPGIVGIDDTVALSRWLISRHGVVVVPGECFGMEGHVRIGIAMDDTKLRAGLDRFATGVADYREQSAKNKQIAL